jgi:hypothetical protein
VKHDPAQLVRTPYKLGRPLIIPSYRRGAADSNAVDAPFLFWFDGIGYRTGLASSDDLLHWDRQGIILERGEPGSGTEFNVAITSVLAADGHARELVAFSDDLLNWRKANEILIDVGETGSIDDQYAHKPGVVARDGVLYHFYGASRKKGPGDVDEVNAKDRRCISVATSAPVG